MTAEPGWQTTEFWLSLVAAILGALTEFHVISFTSSQTQSIIGLVGMVVPIGLYALSRGLRKQHTSSPPAPLPAPPAPPA